MKRKKLLVFLILILFIMVTWGQAVLADEIQQSSTDYYPRGKVIETLSVVNEDAGYYDSSIQMLKVKILDGEHEGEEVETQYELNFYQNQNYKSQQLKVGDEVLLYLETNEAGNITSAYVAELVRDKYLLYLVIVFILLMIIIGRMKGFKALISLVITIVAIFKVMVPLIIAGWNPVLISVGICIFVIIISLVIISGFTKKTISAIVGTVGGVVVAGGIALFVGTISKLTGLGNEESQMLMYIPQGTEMDFRGILFAGIIIGALGAAMDVGMSIASSMNEIKANSPDIKTKDLIKAGMNVGRDMMATMANTLILAYTGGSIQLILVLMAYDTSLSNIINWDMIASEVVRAIAGSIGIIFTIPITALVAGLVEEKFKTEKSKQVKIENNNSDIENGD